MATKFDPIELWGWICARGISMICSACGTEGRWVVGSTLGGVPHVRNNQLQLENGYEVMPVTCQHCGYVRFFAPDAYKDSFGEPYTPPTPLPEID